MRDENGEIIPAGVFIPIIEQLGLRPPDRPLCARPRDPGPDRRSDPQSRHQHLRPDLERPVLAAHTLGARKNKPEIARRLIIELTETSALTDIEKSARFLAAIRELGCRVAVDDFGAGFTSFRHLKTLTLDIVKIDSSFVRNLADNVDNQLFIRNLLGLAEAYGMETVAECVEARRTRASSSAKA